MTKRKDNGRRTSSEEIGKKKSEKRFAIVIFGASGDLANRKIIPALYSLDSQKLLPKDYVVIGVARSKFTDEKFRDKLRKGVEKYARIKPEGQKLWEKFSNHLSYLQGEYDNQETFSHLKEKLVQHGTPLEDYNILFHASTPPSVYPGIVDQLSKAGFGISSSNKAGSQIVVEKPFGRDLETARSLNQKMHGVFKESQVYRIDHYLGKETVQNILTFRFANTIFEPLWNRNYIDHIQITVAESVGVEHRAGYYDHAGVARDMLQNHLLQLVALSAMEPPSAFNEKELRDEKIKVLKTLTPVDSSKQTYCIWGQYEGYKDEEGIPSSSRTPTFVALKLYINNWRWQGVPFYLRTGKKLRTKVSEIIVQFKRVPLLLFPEDTDVRPNRISICVQPDEGLHLRFETKKPGLEMATAPVNMLFHYGSSFGEKSLVGAYEHLLLDAMHGDPSLFDRADGVELAWAFVDPIISSYEKGEGELSKYKAGSWGPKESDELMAQDGVSWHMDCAE